MSLNCKQCYGLYKSINLFIQHRVNNLAISSAAGQNPNNTGSKINPGVSRTKIMTIIGFGKPVAGLERGGSTRKKNSKLYKGLCKSSKYKLWN